jgi:hypothetical protein
MPDIPDDLRYSKDDLWARPAPTPTVTWRATAGYPYPSMTLGGSRWQ